MPAHHGWAKAKKYHEVDVRTFKREPIKGSTSIFNYYLGIDINKDYYEHLPAKEQAKIGEHYLMFYSKSNNSKQKFEDGSIIRVASEEVLKIENEKYPEYPIYHGYISVVLEEIPEKHTTDTLDVLENLSKLQPKRIPASELKRLEIQKSIEADLKKSIEEGKMPKDIYEKYAKENKPLPKEFYVDYREGEFWCQHHIRGITVEEKEDYDAGKVKLADILDGHSVHTDVRMDFLGIDRLIQWVVNDNTVEDLYKMYRGESREIGDGKKGICQSLAIVKPSAEEPEVKKAKEKEPSIGKDDAKLIVELDMPEESYFIAPGQVGATKNTWSYMSCFLLGEVKAGVQRPDYHEYFYYPKECKRKDIFDGRYVVKCLDLGDKIWQFWKAADNPLPADPILHRDQGHYYPIPAKDVKKLSREDYKIKQHG